MCNMPIYREACDGIEKYSSVEPLWMDKPWIDTTMCVYAVNGRALLIDDGLLRMGAPDDAIDDDCLYVARRS
jgi:hypothetical protein